MGGQAVVTVVTYCQGWIYGRPGCSDCGNILPGLDLWEAGLL